MKRSHFLKLAVFILLSQFVVSLQAQELSRFTMPFGEQFYEDDVKISKKQFVEKLFSDPESEELWKQGNKNLALAWLGTGVFAGGLIWYETKNEGDNLLGPGLLTLSGLVFAGIFQTKSSNNKRDAVLTYNKNRGGLGSRVTPSSRGIGIAVHF